jgi:hypothetical protein
MPLIHNCWAKSRTDKYAILDVHARSKTFNDGSVPVAQGDPLVDHPAILPSAQRQQPARPTRLVVIEDEVLTTIWPIT